MDISALLYAPHRLLYACEIHRSVNFRDCGIIRGLHPDLQLHLARPQAAKQLKLFLRQKVRRDLKVEICDSVVMLCQKAPDFHGMGMIAVKCAVHKFHLRNPVLQKKQQFPFYQGETPETHTFIQRGQTVTA